MNKKYSRIIEIPDIGDVLFERSKRAKHINISVKPPSNVRVAIPKDISFIQAVKFFRKKESWVKKNLYKIKHYCFNNSRSENVNLLYAKDYLLKRLEDLATIHEFKYNRATIRNQKTRWGSCSGQNNISLNMQLMNLPNRLIDYVILHELVHTIVKNHSPLFWETLNNYVINAKHQSKELKKYRFK